MSEYEAIAVSLSKVRAPLFLAQVSRDAAQRVVVLHTADRRTASAMRRQAEAALAGEGVEASCRVVIHRRAALGSARSLEAVSKRFGGDPIVFDPTRSIARSRDLVGCSARIRTALGGLTARLAVDPGRRSLYVILDRSRFPAAPRDLVRLRAETLAKVAMAYRAWQEESGSDLRLAVRVGFDAPEGLPLVAIDEASARSRGLGGGSRFGKLMRRGALASMLGLGAAAPAMAADVPVYDPVMAPVAAAINEPAVAAPNFAILGRGAWVDGDDLEDGWGAVGAKAALPLGQLFGFQLDAGIGTDEYYGIGGHLFWRDPSFGLLGVLASYESLDESELVRFAAEGELYVDRFTVGAVVGHQSGDVDDSIFGELDITFYATPNFAITGGGDFAEDRSLGHVGIEWQPAFIGVAGLSLYADAEFGEDDYKRVMAGVNMHFGTNGASLMDRDRRYDPKFSLFNLVGSNDDGYDGPDGGQTTTRLEN